MMKTMTNMYCVNHVKMKKIISVKKEREIDSILSLCDGYIGWQQTLSEVIPAAVRQLE